MEVYNGSGNIVIISDEVCGGEARGAGGAAAGLDLRAAGARVRPSSSHGREES